MDYSNIDAEKGETARIPGLTIITAWIVRGDGSRARSRYVAQANLASKTTSTPRKTMLVFGLAVIVAALCGFAV